MRMQKAMFTSQGLDKLQRVKPSKASTLPNYPRLQRYQVLKVHP